MATAASRLKVLPGGKRRPLTPTSGRRSESFETTAQLPVGDGVVEGEPLVLGHVAEVEVDLVSEGGPCHLRLAERADGVDEGVGDAGQIGLVAVADEGLATVEALFDAVEPSGDRGGQCQVR